jgi:hypothetical protein
MSHVEMEIIFDVSYEDFVRTYPALIEIIFQKFEIERYSYERKGKNPDKEEIIKDLGKAKKSMNLGLDYKNLEIKFVIVKNEWNVKLIAEFEQTLKNFNTFLQVLDLFCNVIKPKAIYHFGDSTSIEQIKKDGGIANTIEYYNIHKEILKTYNYKIGEKNRVE